jgi:hypothetical protein
MASLARLDGLRINKLSLQPTDQYAFSQQNFITIEPVTDGVMTRGRSAGGCLASLQVGTRVTKTRLRTEGREGSSNVFTSCRKFGFRR